jgi:putative transposase
MDTHFDNILEKKKYSSYTVRDIFRKYDYEEEEWTENLVCKQFIYNEDKNELPIPEWWKGQVHSRLPRGAINKFVYSLNSAISNFKNGNIRKFEMKYRSKNNLTDYLNFEDKQYPRFIRKIKSRYWFTTKDRKRKSISLHDIDTQGRGIEIIYEKETERYYLHYPVERDWFPEEDKRIENQNALHSTDENRIISLDPGVRKFLVGYDPHGECIFIGEGANKILTSMLYDIDKTEDQSERNIKWIKVKNMVEELHWKTINFLMENYDTILLPEFKVSGMVRGRKLPRIVKRLMLMYSFCKFKEKLKWKCEMYGKRLIIVDESYTSCTCTRCGTINKMGGLETYDCMLGCGIILDRDVVGARNIFIKNVTRR